MRTLFIFIHCVLFLFLGGVNLYSQIYPVVFSEILYDSPIIEYERITANAYRNGEYIEFYNPMVFDIDISGWTVMDNNSRLQPMNTMPIIVFVLL